MKKITLAFLVILLFSIGFAFAENNTTENLEIEDNGNYINVLSIIDDVIKFDDGFEGFCLDLSKDKIAAGDRFEPGEFTGSEAENNAKLAIIECYRQDKVDDIGKIVTQIGNADSNNDVMREVFDSNEKIGNRAVVDIDNSTEATFNFELLKSSDGEKSDVLAYTVSFKTIETPEVLGTDDSDDGIDQANDGNNTTDSKTDNANDKSNENGDKTDNAKNDTTTNNKKSSAKESEDKTAKESANKTSERPDSTKTVVNKTDTVTVTENNTTTVTTTTVKTVNNTTQTPQNDTASTLLKAAGNPIFILVIVVVIIAIAIVFIRRKD